MRRRLCYGRSVSASVIIPAYNEASRISRCLQVLIADANPNEFDVIVACNGCTDDTVDIARSVADGRTDMHVIEVAEASKIAALNQALLETKHEKCVFMDADIELTTSGVRMLVEALERPGVLAASTALELDLHGASLVSRSYHAFWSELPSIRHGLAGRGVYAISAEGRDRLPEFPQVTADDRFVHLLFAPDEAFIVDDVASKVAAARTARELISRKTRVFAGNKELGPIGARRDEGSWVDVVKDSPALVRHLPAYLGINTIAKLAALRRRGKAVVWQRDESTR